MESLAKGTHYNICACARKETTEGGKKTRRYGRALHDTRVSACSTSGSRYARHPGVGHKKKANRTNDTGRKQYRNMQRQRKTERKTAEERIQKNNDTVKEQKTQKKGERRLTAWKTRSKPQPDKPVKGRHTLY